MNTLSKPVLYYTFVSISIGQLFAQYLSNIDKHLVANTTFSRYTIETRENTSIYSNHKILTTHAMHDSQPCVRYGRRILLLHILNIHRADKAYVKTVYL